MSRYGEALWWRAGKGQVSRDVFNTVRRIENEHGDVFDRFVKLETLYDPNSPDGEGDRGLVTENVIASSVDTVSAIVSGTDIRARVMTDGADWTMRRRARHLEWYAEDLTEALKILPKCRLAFKEAAKKGMGLTKASVVFDEPRIEQVLVENVIVDPEEARDGRTPKQLHQWDSIDADELSARYPKARAKIELARGSKSDWRNGANIRRPDNEVPVLFSWRLPIGKKGGKGYIPGRETVCIDGCDLYDGEYHEEFFPFGVITWSERAKSWYGISGAERIMGIQRALNRRNSQIERILDQNALLMTYVRPSDANFPVKTSRAGAIGIIKGDYPHTPNPPVVSGETYQSRIDLRQSGLNEFGVNQMATHATKPAGLDSGVALREYNDQTTQRFAPQEQGFEQLVLDTIWLAIGCCKRLGKKAPVITRHSRFGPRKLDWAAVDMRETRIQLKAASNLSRTPAGRVQMVIEYAQAGIVSQDEARRLLQHPDLEAELSLYTAALESVEFCLDEIADGGITMPEPFQNLAMCVWRGQAEYLKWQVEGAPEEILEALRQFVVQAAWMQEPAPVANENAGAMNATPPMTPDMTAGMMAPPVGPAPVAALAPEAMNLMAG